MHQPASAEQTKHVKRSPMKKPTLLVPRQNVREVLSPDDAARLLASGSWVRVATTKPPAHSAKRQRDFQRRRKAAGYRQLKTWLPDTVYQRLMAERQPGETQAALLERLLCEVLTQRAKS
ncbi:hypothetical protein [Polaromonas sp. JS666]|uniref:hypothetical protein n=1 Tax=Polaromonas sp. (strain JS666 / ATCC BAA-500) TaxID=296591 RepID=UPI0018DB1EA8|nr:hypothetical protein [Polaromonas sp. JS666]